MTSRFIDPIPQFCDDSGAPLSGGKLYFYDSGTTTFRTTYADSGLTTPNANPVILDASGRPPNIFLQGNYKLVVTDANDIQISTRDPVSGTSLAGEYTDWSITTTYSLNQSVRGSDGEYYVSITNDNLGNDPITSAANWSRIVGLTEWNTNQVYSLNDTVRRTGVLYRSTANNNQGSAPESLVDWTSLSPASAADAVVTISATDTRVASNGNGDVFLRANGVDGFRVDADGNSYATGDVYINGSTSIDTTLTSLQSQITSNDGDITSLQSQITSNDSDISSINSTLASKANTSGTYASLRAQATTKADVGLGSVNNYGASSSVASNSTSTYATTALTNDIYNWLPYTAASSKGVGTVILAYHSDLNITITAGSNHSGSVLREFGVSVATSGGSMTAKDPVALSGTWKALTAVSNGGSSNYQTCMFVRIS